jgi:aminopeptidase
MRDPRLSRHADLLVGYCTAVQPGDYVVIFGNHVVRPLAREVYRAALAAGGNPEVLLLDRYLDEVKLKYGDEAQLDWASPTLAMVMDKADVLINIRGETNPSQFANTDSARQARAHAADRPAIERYFKRIAAGELRWTITRYPTQAGAQTAEMSLYEYEDFVFGGCLLDEPDPQAAWLDLRRRQQRIVDWLAGKSMVVVKGDGVDLSLSIEGRKFINSDGRTNMPSGEVFTSPVEDSLNGRIRFSYPSYQAGRIIDGIELTFKDGRVVEASADRGGEFLKSQLDIDEGARTIAEFAIGTNYAISRVTGDTLFDEKVGGSIHLALGQGFPQAGGTNKSILHWDMVTDMRNDSRITVDGELLYENGKFVI